MYAVGVPDSKYIKINVSLLYLSQKGLSSIKTKVKIYNA